VLLVEQDERQRFHWDLRSSNNNSNSNNSIAGMTTSNSTGQGSSAPQTSFNPYSRASDYGGGYQEEPEYGYGMDSSMLNTTLTLVRLGQWLYGSVVSVVL
jgi:hypothetical protein